MTEALQTISTAMEALGLPYAFMVYNKAPLPPLYFVGEYTEIAGTTEDGRQEATFHLTGYTRGTWLELEQAKERIRKYFYTSYTAVTGSGTGLAISYANALTLATNDAEIKRIQVNLNVQEWKVN